jgi:hypothetical protein
MVRKTYFTKVRQLQAQCACNGWIGKTVLSLSGQILTLQQLFQCPCIVISEFPEN